MMIKFKKIDKHNFKECLKLTVTEKQRMFVAQNIESLAQAYVSSSNDDCIPMPYAIYNDEKMIGFIMMAYVPKGKDGLFNENLYEIWRFMIDQSYQNKGFGKQSFEKALELIKTLPHGPANIVVLSYVPSNIIGKKLYESYGFRDNGVVEDGENISVLNL